jgi:hypothetical protein
VAFGQYCLNTALLPAPVSPLTVTFHPDTAKVCDTPQFAIVAFFVCAVPSRVTVVRSGAFGAAENDTIAFAGEENAAERTSARAQMLRSLVTARAATAT